MPQGDDANNAARGRRRSHHACLPCRRKKTRCPAEKPFCSTCVRLNQQCSYPPPRRPSHSSRSEERLVSLEEKLNRLLTERPTTGSYQDQVIEEVNTGSDQSLSATPPATEARPSTSSPSTSIFEQDAILQRPSQTEIASALALYFKYCHRQPVWLFDREHIHDYNSIPDELAASLLALTSRFAQKTDRLKKYGNGARSLVMNRVARGNIGLPTIESLCLLSYSSFIDGNVHLGQFHLGLALQLCQSARLDHEATYTAQDPLDERKKRLFWTLQILDQYHGQQTGVLSTAPDLWGMEDAFRNDRKQNMDIDSNAPPFPFDDVGSLQRSEPGIWNTSIYLGSVWSRVRTYVSNCAQNIFKEPWRRDSMYAMVIADFMEVENRIPMRHRYDSVKFYERKIEDIRMNRDYWMPWLKEQFTYHAIPAVMNHPFLYIVGAQNNPNLAIPHTFWRRSSELGLIHSTWIARLIDMVMDKQVQLIDPFFGHIAAIAATVHLYYCCSAAPKLKHKSNADFAKCRRFLKGFLPFSPACAALDRNLDKMAKIASASESTDVEDWMPSRIYLSVSLMWKILQFNCMADSSDMSATRLLDPSLTSGAALSDMDESSTIDIIVATSPEISVNTADGGQDAPTLSYTRIASASGNVPGSGPGTVAASSATPRAASSSSGPRSSHAASISEISEAADTLTYTTTPWLYSEGFPSQFANIGNAADCHMSEAGSTGTDELAWWQTDFNAGLFQV